MLSLWLATLRIENAIKDITTKSSHLLILNGILVFKVKIFFLGRDGWKRALVEGK
jgi:hypothetical protein